MASFFFWPFMIASIISSIIGLMIKDFRFLYASAVMIIPLSLYLAATPRFIGWGLLFPFFYIGSAVYVKKKRYMVAVLLNTPVYFVIGWLGYTVLSQ